MLLITLMTGLTCIGSFIRIPLGPVPLTMQTFSVYLSGAILGPVPGFISQVLYLLIGLSGIPVFTSGGGPGTIAHPAFGYLLAFPASAWVIGHLFQKYRLKNRPVFLMLPALSAGMLIILGMGGTGLYIHTRWILGKSVSGISLLISGVLLFLPGELIKILLAGHVIRRIHPLVRVETV